MSGAAGTEVVVRLVTEDDAEDLALLLRANREHLAPWEPLRDERFSTREGQRDAIAASLEEHARGAAHPCVVVVGGEVAGRVVVNGIHRGAFQSANLGYWVAREHTGRGVATAAVAAAVRLAFTELGLHRVQAATLPHNLASRRVLSRNGFTEIGLAPGYLQIAGSWQDHVLHQRLSTDG